MERMTEEGKKEDAKEERERAAAEEKARVEKEEQARTGRMMTEHPPLCRYMADDLSMPGLIILFQDELSTATSSYEFATYVQLDSGSPELP
jgi:hypothetical protein